MRTPLENYYHSTIIPNIISPEEYQRFIRRVNEGKLTREENPLSHTCAMTLAFEPDTQRVLLVHHKKAKSWIFPGGHIELDELPTTTALREAEEELGLRRKLTQIIGPFGAQILEIDNAPQVCREHYDVFYGIAAQSSEITVDMTEFLGHEWLPFNEARQRIALEYYRLALDKFVRFVGWQ